MDLGRSLVSWTVVPRFNRVGSYIPENSTDSVYMNPWVIIAISRTNVGKYRPTTPTFPNISLKLNFEWITKKLFEVLFPKLTKCREIISEKQSIIQKITNLVWKLEGNK